MKYPRKGSRKGSRVTICAALLTMYTIVVMEMGRTLMTRVTMRSSVTRMSAPLLETRPSKNKQRRLSERYSSSEKVIDHESGQRNEKVIDDQSGRRNDFLNWFEDTLVGNPTSSIDATSANSFAALILKNDKVYCRKSQMKNLLRGRYFVQMLRHGLKQYQSQNMLPQASTTSSSNGFPILIKHDDSNGCYPATRRDKYGFPRLTWSIPANTTAVNDVQHLPAKDYGPSSSSWCSAVGMPSYKTWRDLNHEGQGMQNNVQLKNNDAKYPWSAKLPKAVWRGSTTCNKGMYGHLPLQEIPRSRLVMTSLDRPDLIDAGFHKAVGKYEKEITVNESRMLKQTIPLEEMMKYKAIIDIDGNNWSARFQSLLCTNSVIIKVIPDFIEQYYHELEPNVHYILTTLNNLTTVMEEIVEEGNDMKMRGIVKKANEWCHRSRRKESFALESIGALEMYRDALSEYAGDWMGEWESRSSVFDNIDDMVECTV
mmetsp:Transcript_31512/g.66281  ORF Transcript_31512/g.66281 Transcript_31512/m.66281 type:complete len:483 (+) Transcript_31512:27-1475(+)